MRQNLVIAICIAFLGVAAASAQSPAPASGVNYSEFNPSTNLPQQRLGPNDLIALTVYDSPEFSRTVRVGSDGTIRLPMLKAHIRVEGLYPNEAETAVASALKEEKLLVDPFVTISVAEYHSRPINVMGAVRSPTIFQAIGKVTILDAISRAGGLADNAGPEIIITRANGSAAQSVQRIPVKPLIAGSDPELNVQLSGGEEILIPQVAQIIVQGNVNRPGVYPVLDPLTSNTVTSAIAQAGGLAQYWEHTAYIYRTDDKGVKHTIQVPLWDILVRKKPDMVLQARDTLYIPDSPRRRVTQESVQALTGVATGVTTGIVIAARP